MRGPLITDFWHVDALCCQKGCEVSVGIVSVCSDLPVGRAPDDLTK